MPVFKAFFKILRSRLVSIMIYVGIFLVITLAFSGMNQNRGNESFEASKTRMVFINEDQNSQMIEGLKSYLAPYASFVEIEDSLESLQDALFFREIEYILRVPKGFTEGLIKGEDVQVDYTTIPDSSSAVYINLLTNEYFNSCKLYIKHMKGLNEAQVAANVLRDLSLQTEVKLEASVQNKKLFNYMNYLAYAFLSIFIVGIGSIMYVFNQQPIRKRNSCSPVKGHYISMQMLMGCMIFTVTIWLVMTGLGFIIYQESPFTIQGLGFAMNTLALALCSASISFLTGILVKDTNAQNFISIMISLGLSFISGVFVPQEILGEQVLKLAAFTPVYWFVKANEEIGTMLDIMKSKDVIQPILIQLLFTLTIIMIALVINKRKRLNYS